MQFILHILTFSLKPKNDTIGKNNLTYKINFLLILNLKIVKLNVIFRVGGYGVDAF